MMKIVVYGTGGVGGYFGAKIAKAGYDVTFIARGEHLKAIRQNGLKVKSIHGDFHITAKATDAIGTITDIDLVLIAVKTWQLSDVAEKLKPVLGRETMVLPLQNGANNLEKLLEVLPAHNVLGGLCRIVSKVEAPGVIDHFGFDPSIVFGEIDNTYSERLKKIKEVFDVAGIKNHISDTIQLEIWKKFTFITTVSGIAALTRTVFGELRKHKGILELMQEVGHEITLIANAKHIAITQKDVDTALDWVQNCEYNTTASMQRDIMEGRPSELQDFNGYIVNEGLRLGIETPVNKFVYDCLLPQEMKARTA